MFVISFKSQKAKMLLFGVLVALVCCCLVVLKCSVFTKNTVSSESVDLKIEDSASVLNFISMLGWDVVETPDEIREVIIPVEFDDVYTSYNNLQLKQNYDLSAYKGERVKKWSFTVNNYPGYEDKEFIKINVLVYDGEVIGGDVCSVELNGFMHGFEKEDEVEKQQ